MKLHHLLLQLAPHVKERNNVIAMGIRDRLVGCWRLVEYSETADGGEVRHPLGTHPLGTMLYTSDGYMSAQLAKPGPYADDQKPDVYAIAYSGPYEVDEQAKCVQVKYAER